MEMVAKKSSYLRLIICLGLAELFFITPLVFSPWTTTFTITKNTAAELIVLIIFPLWIIYLLESRDYHSLKSSLTLPILAFFLIILISLSQSSSLYDSFKDLARWSTYMAAYFIIISIIREKKLDEAFICYEQGMLFTRDFVPPARLAQAYNKIGIDGSKEREPSSFFSFFSRGGAIVDCLPPMAKSGESIYFKIFLYHPEKFDSFFKASIEIRDESERLVRALPIKNESISSNNPCLLSIIWKEGLPAGNYTAIVRIRYARGKIVWRKRIFSVSSS